MTDTQLKTLADRIEHLEKRFEELEKCHEDDFDRFLCIILDLVEEDVLTMEEVEKRFPELRIPAECLHLLNSPNTRP